MKASDIMTYKPFVVTPEDEVCRAAEIMRYENVGGVPVVADTARPVVVGLITDRDIAVRCVARRHTGTCLVKEVMTPAPIQTATPDTDVQEIVRLMECAEVRRIPIVSDDGMLIGIVAEADLVAKLPSEMVLPARKRVKRFGSEIHLPTQVT